MGKIISSLVAAAALLLTFTTPAHAEESNRGFYEGSLPNGGKAVFFVQGNRGLSAYFFDVAGKQASFAGGTISDNGSFTLVTNRNVTVTGTVTSNSVTFTISGATFTLNRVAIFGSSEDIAGRYTGSATSNNGTLDVRVIVDSQGNIFFIGRNGATFFSGFGPITVQRISGTTGDDHDGDDDDEDQDRNEDREFSSQFTGTFTFTGLNGETISGNLTFGHGTLTGTVTINGVTYSLNVDRESSFNRLANISTRGFVNTGQGQLIGGFIVKGGPKLVMIRALGPTLAASGVNPVLANPKLQLFQNNNLLKENDDWQQNSNRSDIDKTTIAPKDGKEAALLVRLEPGAYTTVVTGADNGTGIALVEVYEIDRD